MADRRRAHRDRRIDRELPSVFDRETARVESPEDLKCEMTDREGRRVTVRLAGAQASNPRMDHKPASDAEA